MERSSFKALREANQVSLETISARTKIPVRLLENLERECFDDFPRGLFARSYVRSYASEAGLDPEVVLARLIRKLPGDDNPHEAVVLCARRREEMQPRYRLSIRAVTMLRPVMTALAVIASLAGLWVGAPRILGRSGTPLNARPLPIAGVVAMAPPLNASPLVTYARERPKPGRPRAVVPPMLDSVSPVSISLDVPIPPP